MAAGCVHTGFSKQSLVVRRALQGHGGNFGVTRLGLCEDAVAMHACSSQVVQRPRFYFLDLWDL